MKGLVRAAGVGERLRPLTYTIPKPLLEIGGRPLIHYPLLMLKRAGVTQIAINVHHLAGEIEAALGNGSSLGIEITYSREPVLLGTGGALNPLREYFAGETFIVANGDTILDLDLSAMVAFHRERKALATLLLARPDNLDDYSRIEIDRDGRIRRMRLLRRRDPIEYDDYPREPGAKISGALDAHMFCGLMVAEPEVLGMLPEAAPWSIMTGLLAPMMTGGLPLFGYAYGGYFRTVDDLASYEALRAEFTSRSPHLHYLR
ncbi:MAG TPA: NDP-sugar synthase [Candidatus Binataceae bacterium]|nr:NDP-sugar synthase [Candidatus Binataceae bacterium]